MAKSNFYSFAFLVEDFEMESWKAFYTPKLPPYSLIATDPKYNLSQKVPKNELKSTGNLFTRVFDILEPIPYPDINL